MLINKPLLIIRLVIIYLFTQKNAYLLFCFLWKGILVEQRRKKTVLATNLRITDCTRKNNMKIHMKSLFKASSRAVF